MMQGKISLTQFFIVAGLILFVSACSLNKRVPSVDTNNSNKEYISSKNGVAQEIDTEDAANSDGEGEYRIIMTPFGPMKKPIVKQNKTSLPKKTEKKLEKSVTEKAKKKEDAFVAMKNVNVNQVEPAKENKEDSVPQKLKESETGGVILNFDNANLEEVVRTFAEILKIDFIIDAKLSGSVDIYTTGKIPQKDLFPIFFQILEINGLTTVKDGRFHRIIRIKDAARLSNNFRFQMDGRRQNIPHNERIVIQLIPLKYISPVEMSKLINPFISADGSLILHESADVIILIDKANVIPKVKKLVETFDVDFFKQYHHKIFVADYVDIDDLMRNIQEILSAYTAIGNDKVKMIPLKRINSFFAISRSQRLLEKVQELKSVLDVQSDEVEPRIYVYSVKNSKADDLQSILTSVFGNQSDSDKIRLRKSKNKKEGTKDDKPPKKLTTPLSATMGNSTSKKNLGTLFDSGTLRGDIKITGDPIRNSLIIEAIPSDYRLILDLLDKIDILPRQVLIEVTIAEILLDDDIKMGVKWSFSDNDTNTDGGADNKFVSAVIGGANSDAVTGIDYVKSLTDKWNVQFHTLASDGKVNILSTPSIIATDNQSASINISDSVPIVSSTYTGGDSDIVQTNVSYRNTGVMLSVTPHVNDGGTVTMEITQEVSNQVESASQNNPSFRQRVVNTALTVKDGQSIVIGGLISESTGRGSSGVPFLSELPFIGFLFGYNSKTVNKRELILFLTPRVITTTEDIDTVTNDFKNKIRDRGLVF